MEDDYLPNNDADEFVGILKSLADIELSILHKAFDELPTEGEQLRYIREQIRDHHQFNDGKIINAYYAKVLVSDPLVYIKEEMVFRFKRMFT
jgi:hypothetical protein